MLKINDFKFISYTLDVPDIPDNFEFEIVQRTETSFPEELLPTSSKRQSTITSCFEPKRRCSSDLCVLCNDEDPPGKERFVAWIDCDMCHVWSHRKCAIDENSDWKNIRRKSWLCKDHS